MKEEAGSVQSVGECCGLQVVKVYSAESEQ